MQALSPSIQKGSWEDYKSQDGLGTVRFSKPNQTRKCGVGSQQGLQAKARVSSCGDEKLIFFSSPFILRSSFISPQDYILEKDHK